jgi:tryptophan synthase alpha chain
MAELFAATAAEDRAALLPYLMAGVPSPAASAELFVAMGEAGADGFEVGLPYADPLMDGPVIQKAGAAALAAGTTVERGLEVLAAVTERTAKPCLLMTYTNPVLQVGPERFAAMAADAGAQGLIVADLPVDECAPIAEAAHAAGLGLVLFVAPTTPDERLRRVVAAAPLFIYGVADMGVTGERGEASRRAGDLASRVRKLTDIPLVLGVGISGPEAAHEAAGLADGVIVGSALVRRVLEAPDVEAASGSLAAAVMELAAAMRRF